MSHHCYVSDAIHNNYWHSMKVLKPYLHVLASCLEWKYENPWMLNQQKWFQDKFIPETDLLPLICQFISVAIVVIITLESSCIPSEILSTSRWRQSWIIITWDLCHLKWNSSSILYSWESFMTTFMLHILVAGISWTPWATLPKLKLRRLQLGLESTYTENNKDL